MQIDSAEKLIDALRTSGLFDSDQLAVLIQDLTAVRGDVPTLLRALVNKKRATSYQLLKVIHGKAADLFLGPYIITDKLGEGGMGKVYRARQVRLDREVAIKVVRSSLLSNPIVRKRYDREVQIASSLSHPNIVGVYDAGEIDGRYYLVMEFVDGIDLARLVRDHRLQVAEACEYARQAALGLHYAHEQELVHRDIKPSNVVVAGERHVPQATEPAVVKVLDMGLVRNVGFDDGGGGDLTRAGTVVGTPDYMAPEQAKNSRGVDRRADLYGLGCTLYFLLIGKPPYPTGTAIEKLLMHQLDAPTPLQALRPEIPQPVAEVVARLMAKKPDDRFQTAAEVAAALAPMAQYPHGSRPVPIVVRKPETVAAVETLPPSGRTTLPPLSSPSSTVQSAPTVQEPVPLAQPVAPSTQTPRPRGFSAALHATVEPASPFSTLTEPPSGPRTPIARAEKATAAPSPPLRRIVWAGLALTALLIAAIVGWLAFGHRSNPGEPEPAVPDDGSLKSAKSGTTPLPGKSRLLPWVDLVVSQPALVVVAYPAPYLREKDSRYAGGAGMTGPGKLASWAKRLSDNTGLPLADSDRVVLSFPAGRLDRYVLTSEGPYLTPLFGNHLASLAALRQPKPPSPLPASVKWFQAPANRVTALIPTRAGPQTYALANDPSLLTDLAARLASGDPRPPAARIDAGTVAAIDALGTSSPLLFAAAGPDFRFPFDFQSLDRDYLTLRDLGIDLVTVRLAIRERMELELTIVGKDQAAARNFLTWTRKKIGDEFPLDGAFFLNQLANPSERGETADGKFRLTLRITWSPEKWSAILDRLFAVIAG